MPADAVATADDANLVVYRSPAGRAAFAYWQSGGVCPSLEAGLADCVTDDARFFQALIDIYEASDEQEIPGWLNSVSEMHRLSIPTASDEI